MFYCRFYLFCAIQVVLAHGVHLFGISCDFFGYSGQEPTANVAIDIDAAKFWDIVEAGLKRYSEA